MSTNTQYIILNCRTFKADESKQCFETNRAKNVVVTGSCVGTHDHGSSKIKLTNIVDYKWKEKNYSGHLIAVHLNGRHVAYAIKGFIKNVYTTMRFL